MSSKKRNECYIGIFNKIDHIEDRINDIKDQLLKLREDFSANEEDEVCIDEVEAEQALLELVNETAIEFLLNTQPKGDG